MRPSLRGAFSTTALERSYIYEHDISTQKMLDRVLSEAGHKLIMSTNSTLNAIGQELVAQLPAAYGFPVSKRHKILTVH